MHSCMFLTCLHVRLDSLLSGSAAFQFNCHFCDSIRTTSLFLAWVHNWASFIHHLISFFCLTFLLMHLRWIISLSFSYMVLSPLIWWIDRCSWAFDLDFISHKSIILWFHTHTLHRLMGLINLQNVVKSTHDLYLLG